MHALPDRVRPWPRTVGIDPEWARTDYRSGLARGVGGNDESYQPLRAWRPRSLSGDDGYRTFWTGIFHQADQEIVTTMQITIDGRIINADQADTIYRAAQKAGIEIPSLCVSDHLAAFGSCRLCICEIEGQSGT